MQTVHIRCRAEQSKRGEMICRDHPNNANAEEHKFSAEIKEQQRSLTLTLCNSDGMQRNECVHANQVHIQIMYNSNRTLTIITLLVFIIIIIIYIIYHFISDLSFFPPSATLMSVGSESNNFIALNVVTMLQYLCASINLKHETDTKKTRLFQLSSRVALE